MKITVEETLAASNVVTALTTGPYLIYSEVLEGARRPLVFLEVCEENFDLIGQNGNQIQFMKSTQLSATEATEATVISTGQTAGDKTLSAVSVTVPNVIYSAVQLSDILKEDFPKVNWLRLHFRNMGKAVMEYLDADVYTVLAAASGVVTNTTTGTLDHGEVVDTLAKMENGDWITGGGITPFLIIAPESKAGLLKDTTFVTTERYTTYEIANMVRGEIGKFAGCRVLTTSHLDGKAYCFIVFPNNTGNGPVVVIAWKRRLTIKNEYEALKAYTYFVTSIRAKPVVVQALGVAKITISTTP